MRRVISTVVHIWRSGFTVLAIVIQSVLSLVLAVDLYRLSRDWHVCVLLPFQLLGNTRAPQGSGWQAALVAVICIFAIPVVVGCARLMSIFRGTPLSQTGTKIYAAHILLCAFLVAAVFVSANASAAAGWRLDSAGGIYTFQPYFGELVGLVQGILARYWLKGLAGLIIMPSLYLLTPFANRQHVFLDYFAAAAELSDLAPEFTPVHRTHDLDFRPPVLAPEIQLAQEVARRIVSRYDLLRPGSKRAEDYLISIAEECRGMITELIVPVERSHEYLVRLTSGTGRAIELALAQVEGGSETLIVVSPFEHENLNKVVAWNCKISGRRPYWVRFSCDQMRLSWPEQEQLICESLRSLGGTSFSRIVLIVSEVCYSTGAVIPVDRLLAAVRALYPDKAVTAIVDGSQSVGNSGYDRDSQSDGRPRYLKDTDCYVFAAHKWLMAPEPCGVLLINQRIAEVETYDSWGPSGRPSATPSPGMVAGLRGGLELIRQVTMPSLARRSHLLQRRFLRKLPEAHLEQVLPGDPVVASRTAITLLRPAAPYHWRPGWRQFLEDQSINLFVPDEWLQREWITVAFPYYLSIWHVDMLSSVLRQALED